MDRVGVPQKLTERFHILCCEIALESSKVSDFELNRSSEGFHRIDWLSQVALTLISLLENNRFILLI